MGCLGCLPSPQAAPPPLPCAYRVAEPIRIDGGWTNRSTRARRRSPTSCRGRTVQAGDRKSRRGFSSTTGTSTFRRVASNHIPSGASPADARDTISSARTTPLACCSTPSTTSATAIFYANAIGGFADSQVTDEGPPNVGLEHGMGRAPSTFDGGWAIEMAIPFKSLRYQPRGPALGHQPSPRRRWKNEWSCWRRCRGARRSSGC